MSIAVVCALICVAFAVGIVFGGAIILMYQDRGNDRAFIND